MPAAAASPAVPALDRDTFERIRQIVRARSGIALGEDKATLVSARLGRRLRELGLSSYQGYLQHLAADLSGEETTLLVDAISTNVTYFFREPTHFDFLARTLGRWIQDGQRRFRLWSAACSTGEEPYTLVMALAEQLGPGIDLKVLATDISTHALGRAMEGRYPTRAIESIPAPLRARHVGKPDASGRHEIAASIRERIVFRHANLVETPHPLSGGLDVIMCRNVMIYFDPATRQRLVTELHRLLRPGGYLIVSHSESLMGVDVPLRLVEPSIYVKPERGGVAP